MADVPVINPRGELVRIDEADVPAAVGSNAGYRLPTDAELQSAESEKRAAELDKGTYQSLTEKGVNPVLAGGLALVNPGGQLSAWREAGLEGATGGLAQAGIAKGLEAANPEWSAAYKKTIQDLREAYPETREAGNVAGNIARDVTLGTMGVPTVAGTLGKSVGTGLGALGATGESVLGRAGIAAAKGAIGIGAENALIGASQEFSEESLGPAELNAEKILAAGGQSGLYGLVFGAGAGAAGSLARDAIRGGIKLAGESAATNADKLRAAANEQRWRALDAPNALAKQAEARVPGGTKAVGEVLGKYNITGDTLDEAFKGGAAEDLLPKISAAKEQVGREIGEIHATSPATIPLGEVLATFDRKIAPMEGQLGRKGVVASAQSLKEELAGLLVKDAPVGAPAKSVDDLYKLPIPIQSVIEQRKALDTLVYQEAKALDPNMRVGLLRDIRADLEGSIKNAIDDAAKKAGNAETGTRLRTLSRDYQALSIAEDAAENTTARAITNRNVSLSGQIAGAAMLASGHGLAAIPTAIAHQTIKSRGNAMAAVALGKLADLGEAVRAIKATDMKVAAAAKGLVWQSSGKALPGPTQSLVRRYADAVEHVSELRANAGEVAQRAISSPIRNAPNLSAAIAAKATGQVAYLANRIPPTMDRPTLGGPTRMPRQTVNEMQRFVTTYEAVKDPQRVLDNLAAGKVVRGEIYALRDTSPELFKELQQKTMEEVAAKSQSGKPLSLNQRLQLGIIFDVPTDPSLEPNTLRALQDSLKAGNTEKSPPPAAGTRSPQRAEDQATGIDRIEAM